MDIVQYVKNKLIDAADITHRNFISALIPGTKNILGIKSATLKKIAKEIVELGSQAYLAMEPEFFEEKLLQGMVMGLISEDEKDFYTIEKFVQKIDNWAICDTFCSNLKIVKKHPRKSWTFLQKYLGSEKEYELRFALVVILTHFVDPDHLEEIFLILDKFRNNGYYAQMAAAWLASVCFVKFPDHTLNYLKISKMDDRVYNRSIQKIIESHKVNDTTKILMKSMKRTRKPNGRDRKIGPNSNATMPHSARIIS